MNWIIIFIAGILASYTAVTVLYNYFLAAAYYFVKERRKSDSNAWNAFCFLIPAHDEQLLIGSLLDSIYAIDYPKDKFSVVVIADNCQDKTSEIARSKGALCLERFNKEKKGKGFAISWSIEQINPDNYDAVLIVDADSVVDKRILRELDAFLARGAQVIQCNNALANPDDSWFTRIFHIVRTIDNALVHHAKHKLGLSSFLMGNGMCLRKDILRRFPWKAYSLSEDFEYYSNLIMNDIFIDYSYDAKVYHQESSSLRQAYSQRSRWSAGKFNLMRKYALPMFIQGIRNKSWKRVEASFIFLFPHTSMLCNLTVFGLVFAYFLKKVLLLWFIILLLLQMFYFVLGLIVARASLKTIISILYAPIYLMWKGVVDIISFLGLGGKEWRRTSRV